MTQKYEAGVDVSLRLKAPTEPLEVPIRFRDVGPAQYADPSNAPGPAPRAQPADPSYGCVVSRPSAFHVDRTIVVVIAAVIGLIVFGLIMTDTIGCSDQCWQTKKVLGVAHETTTRAVGNADANSRAGFGTNDLVTHQYAVGRPAAPVVVVPVVVYPRSVPCCWTTTALPAKQVNACRALGGNLTVGAGGYFWCLNSAGQRMRPDGTLVN